MAQFLKVKAGPVAGDGIETLIALSEIAQIKSVATTAGANGISTIVLKMKTGSTPILGIYTIAVPAPNGGTTGFTPAQRNATLVDIFNSALTANPGGVVSTVVPPVKISQVPAAQSGQKGKLVITQPLVMASFTTCIFSA